MKIRNKILLPCSPDRIWQYIADPALMKLWNPRIREVIPITIGEPKANSKYRIRYVLGRGESNYLAELMEYEEYSRLVLHLEGGNLQKRGYIQEIYELASHGSGTLLCQQIMIVRGSLGLPARLSMRIRNLIGRTSGKKYLRKLAGLIKDPAAIDPDF